MDQPPLSLTDEIIRLVEINRARIDALQFGEMVFRVHQGRLIELGATESVRISAGTQLKVPALKTSRNA